MEKHDIKAEEALIKRVIEFIIKEFECQATPRDVPKQDQKEIFASTLTQLILIERVKRTNSKEVLVISIDGQDYFTEMAIKAANIKESCLPEQVLVELDFGSNKFVVWGDSVYMNQIPTLEDEIEYHSKSFN